MSDENKQNVEDKAIESKPITELLDSHLTKGVIIGVCIYIISYTIFSLFFSNAFGGFISPVLSTVSFFLISRWDRLRESRDVSFQNFKDLIQLPKISFRILLLSAIIIFFVQFIAGFFASHFDNSDCDIKSYSDIMGCIEKSNILIVATILGVYSSYIFGGYFSAKLAIRKNLSPYLHAILGSSCVSLLSVFITLLIIFFETGELDSPYNDDASVGANVLFFSQFFLLPLLGAKIAVITSKSKIIEEARKIEDDKKAEEEFANLVALEKERLKPETIKKQKKKTTQTKTKKTTNS